MRTNKNQTKQEGQRNFGVFDMDNGAVLVEPQEQEKQTDPIEQDEEEKEKN